MFESAQYNDQTIQNILIYNLQQLKYLVYTYLTVQFARLLLSSPATTASLHCLGTTPVDRLDSSTVLFTDTSRGYKCLTLHQNSCPHLSDLSTLTMAARTCPSDPVSKSSTMASFQNTLLESSFITMISPTEILDPPLALNCFYELLSILASIPCATYPCATDW